VFCYTISFLYLQKARVVPKLGTTYILNKHPKILLLYYAIKSISIAPVLHVNTCNPIPNLLMVKHNVNTCNPIPNLLMVKHMAKEY